METTKYLPWFESSVNSEGIETRKCLTRPAKSFESSVNSEGIETSYTVVSKSAGLRAV